MDLDRGYLKDNSNAGCLDPEIIFELEMHSPVFFLFIDRNTGTGIVLDNSDLIVEIKAIVYLFDEMGSLVIEIIFGRYGERYLSIGGFVTDFILPVDTDPGCRWFDCSLPLSDLLAAYGIVD